MSYLLDALKQSEHADRSAEQYDQQAQHAKQQRALVRYRRLAWLLGGSLIVFITLVAGFAAGKWFQSSVVTNQAPQSTLQVASDDDKPITITQPTPATTPEPVAQQSAPLLAVQPSVAEAKNNAVPIHGQVVYVQTPSGIQQMLLTPQGQYIPMLTNQAGNPAQAVEQSTLSATASEQGAQRDVIATSSTEASEPLDLSKYKVLGKPLAATQKNTASTSASTDAKQHARNPATTALETAFEQAIQDTETTLDYEVTQATRNSSRVQPIELLPDGLQALLPPLKYQAHIYSSAANKRWIKLNGRELYEGQSIGALKVIEITPEQSVLDFDGYQFSLKALQDWPQ
ncbi:general secretion pathway protein GspB [Pseudoalteromonas sp.]|uniref:general secretion pathway protein GspB n=1 Tax=Pseudoalteromonas sp. TaxID=53249 RepID=UPI0035634E63